MRCDGRPARWAGRRSKLDEDESAQSGSHLKPLCALNANSSLSYQLMQLDCEFLCKLRRLKQRWEGAGMRAGGRKLARQSRQAQVEEARKEGLLCSSTYGQLSVEMMARVHGDRV